MKQQERRTWAEISLPNLEHNYRALRALLPEGCRFLGVVKADAYGHGAVPVARKLEELGAEYLAVACLAGGRGAHPDPALGLHANRLRGGVAALWVDPDGLRSGECQGLFRRRPGGREAAAHPREGGHRYVPSGLAV